MAVVIKEVVINTTVGSESTVDSGSPNMANVDSQDLINECVEQVMQLLRDNKER